MGGPGEALVLPRIAADARRHAPGVTFTPLEVSVGELRDGLASGTVDAALGINERLGAGCRERAVTEGRYACLARDGHPKIRTRLTLRHFRECGHLLVKQEASSHHGAVVERALRQKSLVARVALQVSSFQSVGPLLAQSDLIGIVPIGLAKLLAPRWELRQ